MGCDSRSLTVDIAYQCDDTRWCLKEDVLHELAVAVLTHTHWNRPCAISILLTDDAAIQELNHTYRSHNKPTNVLSFTAYDDDLLSMIPIDHPIPLGDIVFSYTTIRNESENQHKVFENHVYHLFVHGMLHLLGFDHETDEEAHHMESHEIHILSTFSIPNPYEDPIHL
jgi:probable rRNA maturation factor